MAQVPVLTFDIGAVGDRVKEDKLGWVIKLDTKSTEILAKIEEICNDVKEYKKKKDNFENYKFKSIEEMQKYYDDLYKIVKSNSKIANIYKFMNQRTKSKELEFNQYLATYGHVVYKYEKMRNTKLWRIAKKIKAKIRRK